MTVGDSPYRGLLPFGDSDLDALFFFGREREVQVIAANLLASRLTVLYGPTGVGKSSVLRAGVARSLRDVPFRRSVVVFDTWADEPERRLVEAIAAAAAIEPRSSVVETVTDAGAALEGEFYLVLDQVEEYFVYHDADLGAGLFLAELADVVTRSGVRANVLLCLREDALAKLDVLKSRVPGLFANYLRLDHLEREAARTAIVAPVERWNELFGGDAPVSVEPALVDGVLHQVEAGKVAQEGSGRGAVSIGGRTRIEAAYLQLVLERLWDVERAAGSRSLRLATLEELGGAERIVADHLGRALQELTPEGRATAAVLFHHLVTPSGTKIAHTVPDLARYASVDEQDVGRVVDRLVVERILRPVAGPAGGDGRFEIFHDVLADGVLDWSNRYLSQQTEARARREAEARHRRTLVVAIVALAALVVVGAIAIFALAQRHQAQAHERQARATGLAAQALLRVSVDPHESVRLALDAARLEPNAANESVLRSSVFASRLRHTLRLGAGVREVAFSPASPVVALANGHRVTLWDTSRDRVVAARQFGGLVSAVRFAAAGSPLLVVGGGAATLWAPGSGAVQVVRDHRPVIDAALSADGSLLATATVGGAALWRAADGQLLRRLPGSSSAQRVAVAPNGATVAVVRAGPDGVARASLYDARSGRLLRTLPRTGVGALAFSPDSRLLATSTGGHDVVLWSTRDGAEVDDLAGGGTVESLVFGPDGTQLAAASSDGGVRVWGIANGRWGRLFLFLGHDGPVLQVAFSPRGDQIVSTSEDRTARLWAVGGVEAGRQLAVLGGNGGVVRSAAYSPNGRVVVTGGEDRTARLWDAQIEQQLVLVGRGRPPLTGVRLRDRAGRFVTVTSRGVSALNGDGSLAAVAGRSIVVRRGPRGPVLVRLPAPAGVSALAFDTAGTTLAAGTRSGEVLLWSLPGGKLVHRFPAERGIVRVGVAPGGSVLATGDAEGVVRLWNDAGNQLHVLDLHIAPVTDLRFDSSGKQLASASAGSVRNAAIWDVATGALRHLLIGQFGTVTAVSFSADDRWIVTAGPIAAAIWSVDSGNKLFFLRASTVPSGPADLLVDAEWSPTGFLVATAQQSGAVREYRCNLCVPLDSLEEHATARLAAAG